MTINHSGCLCACKVADFSWFHVVEGRWGRDIQPCHLCERLFGPSSLPEIPPSALNFPLPRFSCGPTILGELDLLPCD